METVYSVKYNKIVGTSPAMRKVFDTLEKIEYSESPVLVEGETGTGKELLAAAIHYNSPRRDKVFIAQNCSAFSDTLLSSELFGHEKGSFTGAISDKKGLFELADEGTLFLDEIGDMDIKVQAKMLRILESGTFYKIGGAVQQNVDVRILTATNKKLRNQIKQGTFRNDLFYRINTLHITLPPLRNRKEDVKLLIDYFLNCYMEMHKMERKDISTEVIKMLESYDWPGNVRELKNIIERLILLSGKNKTIELRHVPLEIVEACYPATCAGGHKQDKKLQDALQAFEKKIIVDKLKRNEWNKTATSKELGISRSTLNDKIARLNIHLYCQA